MIMYNLQCCCLGLLTVLVLLSLNPYCGDSSLLDKFLSSKDKTSEDDHSDKDKGWRSLLDKYKKFTGNKHKDHEDNDRDSESSSSRHGKGKLPDYIKRKLLEHMGSGDWSKYLG